MTAAVAATDPRPAASGTAPALLVPDRRHGWRRRPTPGGMLFAAGDPAAEAAVAAALDGGHLPDAAALALALAPVRGCWALLIDGPGGIAAAVDHVRSLPLFHADGPRGPVIGDDARAVAAAAGVSAVDPVAAGELAMAGYATGARTLVTGLAQLPAGTVAAWPADGPPQRTRHHDYDPPADAVPLDVGDLGAALDAAFDRLVASAAGRPVWVPLSGGRDSRLVLAKLVERAYRPLVAFSYGPRGNSDATVARAVARRLGVEWHFVATPGPTVRAFFDSPARSDYWRFADGLCSVPNMQDVHPLAVLRRTGALPGEAMLVNGQTGDFISGGHIPAALVAAPAVPRTALFDAIADKHFALWRPLLDAGRRASLRARLAAALDLDPAGPPLTSGAAAAAFERFEYAERQAKFVVNGQRAYEWHGLAWALPLWDRDVVDVFARTPLADRAGQSLYRRYVAAWDHAGVFSGITRKVTAWPTAAQAVMTPLAVATRLVAGRARRDRLFRRLNYWDRFGTQYAAFGYREYARHLADARNPVSFYARAWLAAQGIDLDTL